MGINTDEEYRELPPNNDLKKRKQYWEVAKGLQAVDDLHTSQYLETVIAGTLEDKYGTAEAEKKISRYYEEISPDSPEYANKEADIVAARIALILERGGFKFSPALLRTIHTELFQDVFPYKWVGEYRTINIAKSEPVLDGNTVQYADCNSIQETLKYDFEEEKSTHYVLPFTTKQVAAFSGFVSNIWQTHPFREGNTRTIAVFLILYLGSIGVEVSNEPFEKHAKYFRDALVRNNYISIKDGIHTDDSYLQMFFENVLMGAKHDLEAQDLRCKGLF